MRMVDFKNDTIQFAVNYLKNHGIENSLQEARWLFEHVFGKTNDSIREINEEGQSLLITRNIKNSKRFNELVVRRADGEPLQYLLGEWEFYGYPMHVGEGVLIPRPETEFLVDAGKQHLAMRKAKLIEQGKTEEADKLSGEKIVLIDLCAGSGCVGIAMSGETGCSVYGIEISEKARSYAKDNIKLNSMESRIELISGDIFDPELIKNAPQADFIFANPPYLSKKDMEELQKELNFEPETALYGGEDGLDFYKKIFKLWKPKLKEEGLFAVEVGFGQAEAVKGFMVEAGFEPVVLKDYNGVDRILHS